MTKFNIPTGKNWLIDIDWLISSDSLISTDLMIRPWRTWMVRAQNLQILWDSDLIFMHALNNFCHPLSAKSCFATFASLLLLPAYVFEARVTWVSKKLRMDQSELGKPLYRNLKFNIVLEGKSSYIFLISRIRQIINVQHRNI